MFGAKTNEINEQETALYVTGEEFVPDAIQLTVIRLPNGDRGHALWEL